MAHPISSHSCLLGSGVVKGTGAGDIAGVRILAVPFNCCVTLGNYVTFLFHVLFVKINFISVKGSDKDSYIMMLLISATFWDSLPSSPFPFLLTTIQLQTLIGCSFFTLTMLLKLSPITFLPSLIRAFTFG